MRLRVERQGQGADLVLLHGWGMNTGVWEGLPAGFAARVREHRIALPGHGGSPLGAGPATLVDWADACLAAAPERAVWAGWSLGGLLALAAALRAPERVDQALREALADDLGAAEVAAGDEGVARRVEQGQDEDQGRRRDERQRPGAP
ncbi:alpha/beta fold hydrolase [Thiococcus pfennigii]|uniref:alpha/beta fold hydrolase n=1 Tax=Thiococcus pfennigii TaxID=1057 RepID=UPI001F5BF41F|nr:alpha/beta fold hydrolase [Thiococcus pfennigii]